MTEVKTVKTEKEIQCESLIKYLYEKTNGRIECRMRKDDMGIKLYIRDNSRGISQDAGGFKDFGMVHTFLKGLLFPFVCLKY